MYISKKELGMSINQICADVQEKFIAKNAQYGDENGLRSFHDMLPTAKAVGMGAESEAELMFFTAELLADKHRVALLQNGFNDKEFEDRMVDRIVYLMLQLAMYREHWNIWHDEKATREAQSGEVIRPEISK